MLKPENRLTKVRDFNFVIKHGKWVASDLLSIKWLKLAEIPQLFPKKEDPSKFEKQLRLAIVVGLKVSKRAVVRNRLKRQMREVVRLLVKDNKMKNGYYLMFVAKPALVGVDYEIVERETVNLLKRIHLV